MKIDAKKLERQQIGVDKWFDTATTAKEGLITGAYGTFNYATGVGKTFTAILIIKRLFRLDLLHNVVVLVPSEELQKQWKEVLSSNFTLRERNRIEVFTSHWVVTNKPRIKTNTFVVDELHEYYSEEHFKTINSTYIRYDNSLALTANYEDKQKRHKQVLHLYPIIDRIKEDEAIAKGYISSYVEFNLAVELTEEEKEAYARYSKVISKNLNKFSKGGLDLANKCLSGGKQKSTGIYYEGIKYAYGWATYNKWSNKLNLDNPSDREINDIWNPHKIIGYAKALMTAIRLRKELLYTCESKTTAVLELTTKFESLKAIVFSESTAFADKLNLDLNTKAPKSSVVYHSKLETVMLPSPSTGKLIKFGKTRLKKMAIAAIKGGQSRILCASSSLDKGVDIPDLTLGITASGTSNFTQYNQRGGRVKRTSLFMKDKVALLVNLYVKGTRDESWLKTRQSKNKHKIYWEDNVEDISFSPVDKAVFNINEI